MYIPDQQEIRKLIWVYIRDWNSFILMIFIVYPNLANLHKEDLLPLVFSPSSYLSPTEGKTFFNLDDLGNN